ncbi:GreA/GreB family elongation factor, partial [Flavobacteriaceae bacterium]|nr:GreA/GreB family elongation factor [Flavobacteriaceae bacterium]
LLYAHCQKYIEAKRLLLEEQKKVLQGALMSESKSSAGDKHETGRAMVQLDREKLGNQIAELEQNQQKLNTLKNHKTTTSVSLGSVVLTDKENYYISIATNFCEIDAKKYYCISAQSPIGKLLIGKKVNDKIEFNKRLSTILEIR